MISFSAIKSFEDIYNEAELRKDWSVNCDRKYQQCSIGVLDTISDPNIHFDEKGISNYYYDYNKLAQAGLYTGATGKAQLDNAINRIKSRSRKGKYDCILGLSGGVDSTYLAILAKENGLNPLCVHFDYGWNSEIAVANIEQCVRILNFDLYTEVMHWPEFKDLLRSYFEASVLDLDVPADHMIFGALYKVARKYNIKFVLSGNNIQTESILPRTWNYNKFDKVNLLNIHGRFGKKHKLTNLISLGVWDRAYYQLVLNIQSVQLLNYVEYNYEEVKRKIGEEVNWIDYGGKHMESVFTRFYQGFVLPYKWKIDKRKAHLSNLIYSGQMDRDEALSILKRSPYPVDQILDDFGYVAKKLDYSLAEFWNVLNQPNIEHNYYGTDEAHRQSYFRIMKAIKPISRIVKMMRP